MRYLGIEYAMRRPPELDAGFIPFHAWAEAFLEGAAHPFSVAIEREDAQISVFRSFLRGDDHAEANARYLERFVKFLLWAVGGFRVYLAGCERYARAICEAYTQTGARAFDVGFMRTVYERPVEVIVADPARFPAARESTRAIGGHLEGCRIGFDAGGSDRKVSAVIDGAVVYSEEVEWAPKTARDPRYQFGGIVEAFRSAAAHMPRVDAIGVSSAGVFIGNSPMVSSLFLSVPETFREEVKTIYDRAAREIGENVPIVVANDGDVTALAGSLSLGEGAVMGVAMGTSEAAGYVTPEGHVLGWFNELAFAPVDLNEQAARDEWSGDIGVGCKYFSQEAVAKLAPAAGIAPDERGNAETLKRVQKLAAQGDPGALAIFRTIGAYLGHTIPLYARFYPLRHLLVLGRVASGAGGEAIVSECRRVLDEAYPALAKAVRVTLPDEGTRRVGQSIAAASLPRR